MSVYYEDDQVTLHLGDSLEVLRTLPDESVNCVVTSPPYFGLRDYGVEGQYGIEETPAAYVETMRMLFTEVRRVLANDGTLWLNLGDSYSGKANGGPSFDRHRGHSHRAGVVAKQRNTTAHAPYKSLLMIPERVAFALVEDGWRLRNRVVWHKPNAMPESVTDRLANRHEALFLFSKSEKYWFDLDAVREPHTMEQRRRTVTHTYDPPSDQPEHRGLHRVRAGLSPDGHPLGRNPGDVWTVPTIPFAAAHFATMPPALAERCVRAGARPGGVVLDPFSGSGTSGMVALRAGRCYVGIDLSAEYLELSLRTRLQQGALLDECEGAS
jgi:site-specific DNA-methyltransferase (cytosine-N4-specific)